MSKAFFFIALFTFPAFAFAQQSTTTDPSKEPKVFTYVEQMPTPTVNISAYLSKNLHYPKAAIDKGIVGRVIVKFVVDEEGNVVNAEVLRGIGGGCDEEAKRVVMSMPKWHPGKQKGQPVSVSYTLPIAFKLPEQGPAKQDK